MAGFFKRLFTLGQAEAHNLVDKLEDPIKLSEQGIRDLKKDLTETMKSLAEVKGMGIKLAREAEKNKARAKEYEQKAMTLIKRGEEGSIDAAQAERLAIEALNEKEKFQKLAVSNGTDAARNEEMVGKLQATVTKLKSQINGYENDLMMLKTRARTADATKKLNKQLAQVDSSGTISLLEKMKSKVEEDEALAEAYGDLAGADQSLDDEINKALLAGDVKELETSGDDRLKALKAKMGM